MKRYQGCVARNAAGRIIFSLHSAVQHDVDWTELSWRLYLLKRSSHLRESTSWNSDFSSKQSHTVGFMVT